ncbi:Peptidoglycan/LPS O-acetylase OafA/YrhL, contains acyltransferase and SGNH-hydrolase domains [Amycolatopsis xylanica]|uniref:Peptidoglycan/LPS O-acetylase OafA/YrhL, contains acyltransferase and SGNH-hydrolase domains n=1 Tax=Amycolatopsis xylanica TaxID=589385 RepID=A0A1H3R785_9PSEU|nr:acyltransferase [Amycolatopsis xylanica]SDZ21121.1 Peptidoglycan/LPS O-acetylase OafA/YrhL, contains acyltransferase and SGNH-hydrolase domains [Amycolatopsis xylanica]
MLTYDAYLATRRFPALDGLRAVAAVLVVVFHYGGENWVRANGWIGVHMFFVLSGYLITTLALREEARNGRVSLADFYIRRVFRIMPVYYAVLLIVVLLTYLRGEYPTSGLSGALPYFLTFTNEYHVIGVFGQAWTLGVEQKFYLVWPLLAFGIAALGFAKRFSLGLALVATMFALIPVMPYAGAYANLLIGCVLAVALHHRKTFAVLRVFSHPVAGVVMVALIAVLQMSMLDIEAFFGDGGRIGGTTYALLVALLVPALINRGPVSWVLSLAPMRFIGERSYSLYLLQGVAGIAVAATIPQFSAHRTLTAVAVTLVSLAMADMLYRWVEQPMIGVGRRIVARRHAKIAARRESVEDPAPALASASS